MILAAVPQLGNFVDIKDLSVLDKEIMLYGFKCNVTYIFTISTLLMFEH